MHSKWIVGTVALLAITIVIVVRMGGRPRPVRVPRDLLLTPLDTTRADHLGAYGDRRARTPRLDRLANEGVLFERALAAAPITLPPPASLFTGLYPFAHGVRNNGNFSLNESAPTLATTLHEGGYLTAAFVSAFVLDRRYGLARGFDEYDDRLGDSAPTQPARGELERRGDRTARAAGDWPAANARDSRPLFVWMHLIASRFVTRGSATRTARWPKTRRRWPSTRAPRMRVCCVAACSRLEDGPTRRCGSCAPPSRSIRSTRRFEWVSRACSSRRGGTTRPRLSSRGRSGGNRAIRPRTRRPARCWRREDSPIARSRRFSAPWNWTRSRTTSGSISRGRWSRRDAPPRHRPSISGSRTAERRRRGSAKRLAPGFGCNEASRTTRPRVQGSGFFF